MAPQKSSHRSASGQRRASNFRKIDRSLVKTDEYPWDASSIVHALHDARSVKGILLNSENFAPTSTCDVFEVMPGVDATWKSLDDAKTAYFVDDMNSPTCLLRVVITHLTQRANTTYGCQVSLSANHATRLLDRLGASPQFANSLLGEPDYWAPGKFEVRDANGDLNRMEFFCQQPRWNIHVKLLPCSTYMSYDHVSRCTTYIISCSKDQSYLESIKERLSDCFGITDRSLTIDPFTVHVLVAHQAFQEAGSVITPLRYRLYDALDRVDIYAEKSSQSREREELEDLTIELNVISQDVDSLLASADMTSMIATSLEDAHSQYERIPGIARGQLDAICKISDALRYLARSVEAQKRWLVSYRTRRENATSLVFNLVTQQDSATSTTIARETKADGAAMKVIAALTMLFLPGTFLSSVFGMSIVHDRVTWWLYVALTVPLTFLVFVAFVLWVKYDWNIPGFKK